VLHVDFKNNVSFGRLLTKPEEVQYGSVLKQAQEVLGLDGGRSVLIVHEPCLPQGASNTGVGVLGSDKSLDFLEFMKKYLGINSVEILPSGDYKKFNLVNMNFNPNPYCASSFGLGEQVINLDLLASDDFSSIISKDDVKKVAKNNLVENLSNTDNVIGENSIQRNVLKKAWWNFQQLDFQNPLKSEFELFKKENMDFLESKALYEMLSRENGTDFWENWPELDKNLLDIESEDALNRIKYLKKHYDKEIDFFYFRQFLSEKSLSYGKKRLNKQGLDLIGDCQIGFSNDEIWANKKAFRLGEEIGWGLPSIDYSKFRKADGTLDSAGELLKRKFEYFLKRYDGLRFDAGWSYVTNRHKSVLGSGYRYDVMGDRIISLIEETAKEVKGSNFDLKKLMYEVEADGELGAFDWYKGEPYLKTPFENRTKIFTTSYMDENWGSTDFLLNKAHLNQDEFIIGVGNHDGLPLRKLADGVEADRKAKQVTHLSNFFNETKEFLSNPTAFIKAKNAEIFGAKNRMHFYMDVFGREECFNDIQTYSNVEEFRFRIPDNFRESYAKSLEEGYGLNVMESLKKMFIKTGKDKTNPQLFEQISNFSKILEEPTKVGAEIVENIAKPKGKGKIIAFGALSLGAICAFAGKILKNRKNNAKNVQNQNGAESQVVANQDAQNTNIVQNSVALPVQNIQKLSETNLNIKINEQEKAIFKNLLSRN